MTDENQSELDQFTEQLGDEVEKETETESKPEKKTRKKTKKKRSQKGTSIKSLPKESALEKRQRIIHEFIQKHTPTCSLERMIVIFAKEYNCPRLLTSEIRNISASRNPYHILDYMYSQRTLAK